MRARARVRAPVHVCTCAHMPTSRQILRQSEKAYRSSQEHTKTDLMHFLLFCNHIKMIFKQSQKESVDMHSHRRHHSVNRSTYSENIHKQPPGSGAQILSFNSRRKKTWGMLWSCWQNEVFIQDATVKIVYFTAKEILWRNMLKAKHALILFANKK